VLQRDNLPGLQGSCPAGIRASQCCKDTTTALIIMRSATNFSAMRVQAATCIPRSMDSARRSNCCPGTTTWSCCGRGYAPSEAEAMRLELVVSFFSTNLSGDHLGGSFAPAWRWNRQSCRRTTSRRASSARYGRTRCAVIRRHSRAATHDLLLTHWVSGRQIICSTAEEAEKAGKHLSPSQAAFLHR